VENSNTEAQKDNGVRTDGPPGQGDSVLPPDDQDSTSHESALPSTFQPNIDELLPSDLLADNEVVIFAIKPSLWTVAFLSFRTVVIAAAVAAATMLAALAAPAVRLDRLGPYLIEACAVVALGRVGFALLQWLSRTYVLTDSRVIRIRGVFTIDIFQCALVKIQNTFLVLTLPHRILNLGNIELTTAGTGSVEAVWRHCKNPLKVHQQLLRAINRASNPPGPGKADNAV